MEILTLSELVDHVLDLLVLEEESLGSHVVVRLLNFRWTDSRDTSCILCRLWSHVIGRRSVPLIVP